MIKVDEFGNIRTAKGDSGTISVIPYVDEETGEIYTLADDESAVFSVYTLVGGEAVIERTTDIQDEDGVLTFSLSAESTDLPRGEYVYDVRLVSESEQDTFVGGDEYKPLFRIV